MQELKDLQWNFFKLGLIASVPPLEKATHRADHMNLAKVEEVDKVILQLKDIRKGLYRDIIILL